MLSLHTSGKMDRFRRKSWSRNGGQGQQQLWFGAQYQKACRAPELGNCRLSLLRNVCKKSLEVAVTDADGSSLVGINIHRTNGCSK